MWLWPADSAKAQSKASPESCSSRIVVNVASRCCSSSSRPRLSRPGALLYASASTTICQNTHALVRRQLAHCCMPLPDRIGQGIRVVRSLLTLCCSLCLNCAPGAGSASVTDLWHGFQGMRKGVSSLSHQGASGSAT